MSRARWTLVAGAMALAVSAAGCGSDAPDGDGAGGTTSTVGAASSVSPSTVAGPVTVENCGRQVTVTTAPTRIVGLDQISTELLLHLGVGDRVAGTANQSDPPFADIAAAFGKLKVLAANYPSAEEFVAADADFVVGNLEFLSYSRDAGFGGAFGRDELEKMGIGSFALICNGEEDTPERLFERFEQLGRLLGAADTAAKVMQDVRASLDATAKVLAGATPVPTLIYIDGSGPIQTLTTALERAGGKNVIGPDEGGCCPPEVGVEVVAARQPAAVLISSFGNLDPSGPTAADKEAALARLLPTVPAVTAKRYLAIDFITFSTPPRLARDVNLIGAFLHPELTFPS